jgi:hypothetical protein
MSGSWWIWSLGGCLEGMSNRPRQLHLSGLLQALNARREGLQLSASLFELPPEILRSKGQLRGHDVAARTGRRKPFVTKALERVLSRGQRNSLGLGQLTARGQPLPRSQLAGSDADA